jgi:hypothetical protein|tara:strand:+ start:2802 stop:2966 length:165 start_codon:yes stop_codon:yes gene_type:complete
MSHDVNNKSSFLLAERGIVQRVLPLKGGGSGTGYRTLPLFRAANDAHEQERRHG